MVMGKLNEAFSFISKFALLNIIWLGLTIAGAGVLGFFPATVALFSITRRWVRSDNQGKVGRPFWEIYKAQFFRANLYGWLSLIVGGVLYLNFHAIQAANGETPFLVVIAYLLVVTLYFLVMVTILPVSLHFEGGLLQTLKHTFQFIFGKIHLSLLFAVLIWAGVYLSLSFPAAILFFSGSVLAYMLMWFFNRAVQKLEAAPPNKLALKG